jgi:sensor c-di-GMP phosphodiesterase-like protein
LSKIATIGIALVAGVLAIAIPIVASLYLSNRLGLQEEQEQALEMAGEVMRRSEQMADQIVVGFQRLETSSPSAPCSEAHLALMRDIDISSSMIQMVGYVADDRLLCSSLGGNTGGVAVGPVDYRSQFGLDIRAAVDLAFAPGQRFVIIERHGNAIVIHRDPPIDVYLNDSGIGLGVVARSSRTVLTHRGDFVETWINTIGDASEAAFFDGHHVVGMRRSSRYDLVSYVALSAPRLAARVRAFATVLLPAGGLVGALLAGGLVLVVRHQMSLPVVLRAALKNGEFFVVYQPIVDLRTRELIGAEALIRWRRRGELVRPDFFIPAAEEAGLIRRITGSVVEMVARDAPRLLAKNPRFHIGINLSVDDLQSPETVHLLSGLVRRTGVSPRNIIVESTERGLANVDLARELFHRVRDLGIGVAIDDFGTGYSSLSQLETFAFDYLKIDKHFVETLDTEAPTSQVVLHIIEMAKSLNLEMIAEGVETEAQAEFLRSRGVEYGQGWLFGQPMAVDELLSRLAAGG